MTQENYKLLNDEDIVSEIFIYLGMFSFDIERIKTILKTENHAVMAGGSVANTLLNIQAGNLEYPVNDIDIFVLSSETRLKKSIEEVQSKPDTTKEYLQLASPKLYMVDRTVDEEEDIDLITMQLDLRYKWDEKTIDEINFPRYVLRSFDLNCVEVGIFWNGETFELIWSPEFEKFLETKKVEITNVHSMVTLPRALKKASDLNCFINIDEEFLIMWYGCNSRYLNPMTEEQERKHLKFLPAILEELAVLQRSQPLHDGVYQSFFETEIMGNRRDKIRLLRHFRNPLMKNFFCSPSMFYKHNVLYLSTFYNGDLSDFFGEDEDDTLINKVNARCGSLEKFLSDTNLYWLVKGITVTEANTFFRQVLFDGLKTKQEIEDHAYNLVRLEYILTEEERNKLTVEQMADIPFIQSLVKKKDVEESGEYIVLFGDEW